MTLEPSRNRPDVGAIGRRGGQQVGRINSGSARGRNGSDAVDTFNDTIPGGEGVTQGQRFLKPFQSLVFDTGKPRAVPHGIQDIRFTVVITDARENLVALAEEGLRLVKAEIEAGHLPKPEGHVGNTVNLVELAEARPRAIKVNCGRLGVTLEKSQLSKVVVHDGDALFITE